MSLTSQERRQLVEYGDLFRIRPGDYAGQEEEAFYIFALLYSLPSVEGADRRRYRDGVLRETDKLFGQSSRFFTGVTLVIADDIVQPAWIGRLDSNEELIRTFKWLLVGATILSLLGISPVMGSARRGVEESIRQNSVRAGVQRAKQRLLQGAGSGIIEALTTKVATRIPVGAALVALGVIGYYAMERKMNQIREKMTERFEAGLATEAELDQISNANFTDIVTESVGAYWD